MNHWRRAAYMVLGLWTAWWTFFAIAVGVADGAGPVGAALRGAAVAGILSGMLFVAWRWPRPGARLVAGNAVGLLACVLLFVEAPPATTWYLVLTLVAPPLLAGLTLGLMGSARASARRSPALAGSSVGLNVKPRRAGRFQLG